jgi:transcriptional regulator with XRE-family HTH domain
MAREADTIALKFSHKLVRDMPTFGEYVTSWREKRGFTRSELARLLGVSPTHIGNLERDLSPAPTPSLNPVLYHPQLEADYLNMINEVSHNYYNYVTTGIKKSKGGYTLWAYHSFFGQYEFEIGPFGKEVSAWISKNYTILKRGKITRVGVHGTGPYASYTYFEVN